MWCRMIPTACPCRDCAWPAKADALGAPLEAPPPPVGQVHQFNYRDPPHLSDPFSDSIGIVFVTALAWGWAVRLQISPHLTNPFLKTSHVGMGTVFMVCVWLGVAPFCAHIFGNKFASCLGRRPRVWCVLGWGAVEGSSCGLGFGVAPALNCVSHRAWAGP